MRRYLAYCLEEEPNIWTDGSREDFSPKGGCEVAGAGAYVPASELAFESAVWGVAEEYLYVMLVWIVAVRSCLSLDRSRRFSVVNFGEPSSLCSPYSPCDAGIDNLNVARSIGRLLDRGCISRPLGDLAAIALHMIRARGLDTVLVTKVKGLATDADVDSGRVRLKDKHGNAEAAAAADLGRRHQCEVLIDARRRLLKVRGYWYPIMLDLNRFMVAIARVSVNHDGRYGTAPDPPVWDQGSKPKVRKLAIRVNVDLASLPGPPGSWMGLGFRLVVVLSRVRMLLPGLTVSAFCDVQVCCFFTTLHWLAGNVDMGHFGVSFLEVLILSRSGTVTSCSVKRLLRP